MTLIEGIVGSVIAAGIVALIVAGHRRWFGQRIRIIEPREHDLLPPAETHNNVVGHPVRGTLKQLPKGHEIWLLVMDTSKTKVWPQGFSPVEYDADKGTWKGYVHVWGWNQVTVVAVIAPPTSQDFFNYYQRLGREGKTKYEPIARIPAECKKSAIVQTRVPKPGA
jgi:hypothetical protein